MTDTIDGNRLENWWELLTGACFVAGLFSLTTQTFCAAFLGAGLGVCAARAVFGLLIKSKE